jgi:hypothetical protein
MPRILVVDDDVLIVSLIEKILAKTGFQIIKAYDGEEALEKVSREEPDLIILDIMMPKIDGLEVCRRIKSSEDTRLIPVVMLTSKDFAEDIISGFESGADDYITKPFNPKEFVVRIKGLVDTRMYQHKRAEGEKLEALEKMVEGVAHEIRNPIVAIGGFARRIRSKLQPGDTLQVYADHIIHEVERLETMITEILKLQTIVVSMHKSVNIKETVDMALTDFSPAIDKKQIAVNKHYAPNIPLIGGDKVNLKKVFSNVIENAIEAMDEHGRLFFEIELKNKQILVIISDSGRGIPKSELSRIIRPFYTSKMSGAGMGLTMVKHILGLHGGDISISSVKDEGTRVTISLPITADDKPEKTGLN